MTPHQIETLCMVGTLVALFIYAMLAMPRRKRRPQRPRQERSMTSITVVGNYLNSEGAPVLATQVPSKSQRVLGGAHINAVSWTCRWVTALHAEASPYVREGENIEWQHNGVTFTATPDSWIVWDGARFKTVPPLAFTSAYMPVTFTPADRDRGAA